MNNKELQKIFFKTFLITVVSMLILSFVSIGTYMLIVKGFTVEDEATYETGGKEVSMISDVRLGSTYLNLIYSANETDKVIDNVAIEVFNTKTGNLDIVTLPANTEYTMSDTLYKRLSAVNPQIPQVIKIGNILQYFDAPEAYQYGQIIVEDMLGIELSFYTKITDTVFGDYLEAKEMDIYSPDAKKYTYSVLCMSSYIKNDIMEADIDSDNITAFLTKINSLVSSNLTNSNRLSYKDAYLKVSLDRVYYWHAFGKDNTDNSTFEIDAKQTKSLIKDIMKNSAYTQTQEEYNKLMEKTLNSSSKDLNIRVLNGADYAGQAGKYKNILKEAGYKVVSVGDNDEVLDSSMIITKDSNTGYDLLKYFDNAQIKKGDVPEGIDILVIVGKADIIKE